MDTVGKYEGAIKEYIQNQLQEDIMNDQISLKEFVDPFTGEPVKQGKEKQPPSRGPPQEIGPYRACSNYRFNRWF